MIRNILLCAALVAGLMSASGADYSLPFDFAMDSQFQFDECTVIANTGKWTNTWEFDTNCFKCDYDTSTASDDWLITPAVDFGTTNRIMVSIDGTKSISNQNASFEVWLGRDATAEAMTVSAINVTNSDIATMYRTYTAELDTEGGVWYIGIHCTSPSFSTAIKVKNLKVESLGGNEPAVPEQLYILGDIKDARWNTSASPEMTRNENSFTAEVTFEAESGETMCYFNLSDALGSDWDELNMTANRYGAVEEGLVIEDGGSATIHEYLNGVDASGCLSWAVAPGKYAVVADFDTMSVSLIKTGGDDPDPAVPEQFYIIGEVDNKTWSPSDGVEMMKNGETFYATVDITGTLEDTGYFSFARNLANSWDALNVSGNRFAPAADTLLVLDGDAMPFGACADGNSAKAFYAANGRYDVFVDWTAGTVCLRAAGSVGIDMTEEDLSSGEALWYNLQGQRVQEPVKGIYIRVHGDRVEKVYL